MRVLNNNRLEAELITKVSEIANFVSFKELNTEALSTSNIEITILTNNNIEHVFIFDYHLKLLSLKHHGDLSKLTSSAFVIQSSIAAIARELRAGILK